MLQPLLCRTVWGLPRRHPCGGDVQAAASGSASAWRLIFSCSAVRVRLKWFCSRHAVMSSRSKLAIRVVERFGAGAACGAVGLVQARLRAGNPAGWPAGFRCVVSRISARSMTLRSSRTLPGQWCDSSFCRAAREMPVHVLVHRDAEQLQGNARPAAGRPRPARAAAAGGTAPR